MALNPDTRIAVHCYEGDGHQVSEAIEFHLHHGCPVTILSPTDSKVTINHPGVDNQYGGKRAYIGQDSLDRQAEHLRLLLQYPENHFLLNDADSVVLDPKLPDYLYAQPDTMWSNQVNDGIPQHQETLNKYGWPRVAFQPPYFLSRKTIEAMLAVKDDPRCKATDVMPFIDYYMVQLCMVAGLPWARFMDCMSCPIAVDLRKQNVSARDTATYSQGFKIALDLISKGAFILHSVKNVGAIRELVKARQAYLATNPDLTPKVSPPPVVSKG